MKRVTFANTERKNSQSWNLNVTRNDSCKNFELEIKKSKTDHNKPISIDLKYDLIHKVPPQNESISEQTFCETCVMLDPREQKSTSVKVAFKTGEKFIPDLILVGRLMNVTQPFILGSSKSIDIQYEIFNVGEEAHSTQLKISIPINSTQFSRVPSSCKLENSNGDLTCEIKAGETVVKGEKLKFDLSLETEKLDGKSFKVLAVVSSAGSEKDLINNKVELEIVLTEFSELTG